MRSLIFAIIKGLTDLLNMLQVVAQKTFENIKDIIFTIMEGPTDFPSMLRAIGVAFLTILIPVAIAIFREKNEFETLDRNVILDHIIKARSILIYLAFIFLPFLFWNGSCPWLRLIEVIIWTVGVYFMTKLLVNSYHWMKGNKFNLRFDYLRKLRNTKDMEESWRSVWQTEKINTQNEQEFLQIFSSTINELLNKK